MGIRDQRCQVGLPSADQMIAQLNDLDDRPSVSAVDKGPVRACDRQAVEIVWGESAEAPVDDNPRDARCGSDVGREFERAGPSWVNAPQPHGRRMTHDRVARKDQEGTLDPQPQGRDDVGREVDAAKEPTESRPLYDGAAEPVPGRL